MTFKYKKSFVIGKGLLLLALGIGVVVFGIAAVPMCLLFFVALLSIIVVAVYTRYEVKEDRVVVHSLNPIREILFEDIEYIKRQVVRTRSGRREEYYLVLKNEKNPITISIELKSEYDENLISYLENTRYIKVIEDSKPRYYWNKPSSEIEKP